MNDFNNFLPSFTPSIGEGLYPSWYKWWEFHPSSEPGKWYDDLNPGNSSESSASSSSGSLDTVPADSSAKSLYSTFTNKEPFSSQSLLNGDAPHQWIYDLFNPALMDRLFAHYQQQESQSFTSSENLLNWLRSEQSAQNERDWQEFMRGSNYQALVKDLRAAGLNPALAYVNGNAVANTPTGAAGHAAGNSSSAVGTRTGAQGLQNFANLMSSAKSIAQSIDAIGQASERSKSTDAKYIMKAFLKIFGG